jgi:esterase/lipase superfamily enzyme
VVVKVFAEEPDNTATVSVYYATDRKLAQDETLEYSGERNPSGTLRMGKFDVSIPKDHRLGAVERPTIWTMWRENPAHDFVIIRSVTSQRNPVPNSFISWRTVWETAR